MCNRGRHGPLKMENRRLPSIGWPPGQEGRGRSNNPNAISSRVLSRAEQLTGSSRCFRIRGENFAWRIGFAGPNAFCALLARFARSRFSVCSR